MPDKIEATNSFESGVSGDASMRWYIIHAYSNCEDKVLRALKERIDNSGLVEQFGEMVVPAEDVVEMHRGKKRKIRRKNYPGYVLVQLMLNDATWQLVRSTPHILGFVGGTAGRPVPISNAEADVILRRAESSTETKVVRHRIVYEAGEVVRIKEGPFADFDGEVETVNYEKDRLRVSVVIFGRATPVELEFGQVEKI